MIDNAAETLTRHPARVSSLTSHLFDNALPITRFDHFLFLITYPFIAQCMGVWRAKGS